MFLNSDEAMSKEKERIGFEQSLNFIFDNFLAIESLDSSVEC